MRLDKWLWVARFFRTRALAQAAIEGGRVKLAGERVKSSREVRPGDRVQVAVSELSWDLCILALSERRGPAPAARRLYEESEASRLAREQALALRRMQTEPARTWKGRPTKRDRRALERLRGGD